jgi:hypothetical protein
MEPPRHQPGRAARRALNRAVSAALLCGQLLFAALLAVIAEPAGAENSAAMAELLRTGDLICELRASGPYSRGRFADRLLIVDHVADKRGQARVVSSRRAGAHGVKVYAGETGVHLVEDLNGSVIVTTLTGCESRARSGRCQRYSTVNAWHFDQSVHRDPDRAFRRLPGTSYSGTCDAWRMEDPVRAAR